MYIKELETEDYNIYRTLCRNSGNVFLSPEWLNLYDGVKLFGIYNTNNQFIGGFHIAERRIFGLKLWSNAPYTFNIGPVFNFTGEKLTNYNFFIKSIGELMANFFDEYPFIVKSLTLDRKFIDTQPFYWKKFKVIPHYTYLLDLKTSKDEIWNNFSTDLRNYIRKAEKDGIKAVLNDKQEIIEDLVLKTFQRNKIMENSHYIKKILKEFTNKDNSYSYIAYKENRPIAVFLAVINGSTASSLFSGYDSENKHIGAGAFLCWHIIQHALDMGLETFDVQGSMLPQIERFYRPFGAKLVPYYRINKAPLLVEMLLKPFYRNLF